MGAGDGDNVNGGWSVLEFAYQLEFSRLDLRQNQRRRGRFSALQNAIA
jgi:hypothetical protein